MVNGDAVMLIAARDMKARGTLAHDTVVATTMSNMGLEKALRSSGIRMLRAQVGDKYVLEEMLKTGAKLGGEQSGHILFMDGESTTGDGLLTALRVLEVLGRSGKKLSELVADFKVFPQVIRNIKRAREDSFRSDAGRGQRHRRGRARTRRQWPRGCPLLRHREAGARHDRGRIRATHAEACRGHL